MEGKKGKIIIGIMVTIIVILSILLLIKLKENKVSNCEQNITKEKYYENMHKLMFNYYKIAFDGINTPEGAKNIAINLNYLEKNGFPISEFVIYDTKELCDKENSYAVKEFNPERIYIYYSCGEDKNYEKK